MREFGKIAVQKPDLAFFTADPHFFHEGIMHLSGRPFRNAQEMGEALIRNWNGVVPMGGTVFVLGDMFWKKGGMDRCARVMERLNGTKYLVAGNHDLLTREEYLAMGFEDALDYLELSMGKRRVVCCHYPLLEWNGFYRGALHLHGHVHGRGSHFSFRVKDAGVDANGLAPVPWRQIEREMDGAWELDQEAMAARGDDRRHCPYAFKE